MILSRDPNGPCRHRRPVAPAAVDCPLSYQLAAENLFLRKQLALSVERTVRAKTRNECTRIALARSLLLDLSSRGQYRLSSHASKNLFRNP